MTSLPDLSDQYSEQIQVGKLALKSYGSVHSIAGEIYTVSCSDDTIGIFAKGVVAQKTNKKNHGFEDVLISFGSVVMSSGKWIYIDQNGWLVADNKLEL